jgi:hypothetical protein
MGRRKKTDEKTAKPIRGPGRKAKKQGEPIFPKELTQTGAKYRFFFFSIKYSFFLESSEKKKLTSRSKKRFEF